MGLLITQPAPAQPADVADRLAEVERRFAPAVTFLNHERRVVRSDRLSAVCDSPGQRIVIERWLGQRGVAVLNTDRPGLSLHYYAQGIDTMTPADLLWERLPRRADSLQHLIDDAITRARARGRPIARLIITGHAGLHGCCALGGTLADCVFDGRLTGYQRRQLRRLRPYLADDAEIELRQCATAGGPEGLALLTALHRLTGARVSSYLSDFHFGDSGSYARLSVGAEGVRFVSP